MQENRIIRLVYTFFVGLLLAFLVGVGISAFYEEPKYPVYPPELTSVSKDLTDKQVKMQEDYYKATTKADEDIKIYSKNISMIALAFSVAFLFVSLAFEKRIKMLSDGIMFGGLFTLFYSIIRGMVSQDNKYLFIAIIVGLVPVFYLGYHHFVKQSKPVKNKNK